MTSVEGALKFSNTVRAVECFYVLRPRQVQREASSWREAQKRHIAQRAELEVFLRQCVRAGWGQVATALA